MAQIILNIADASLPRAVEALCARGHWTAAEGAKAPFAKSVLAQWLKEEVRRYERAQAEAAAVAAVQDAALPDIS